MSGAMLHGLGDCTPELNCGCMKPEEARLGDEADRAARGGYCCDQCRREERE